MLYWNKDGHESYKFSVIWAQILPKKYTSKFSKKVTRVISFQVVVADEIPYNIKNLHLCLSLNSAADDTDVSSTSENETEVDMISEWVD